MSRELAVELLRLSLCTVLAVLFTAGVGYAIERYQGEQTQARLLREIDPTINSARAAVGNMIVRQNDGLSTCKVNSIVDGTVVKTDLDPVTHTATGYTVRIDFLNRCYTPPGLKGIGTDYIFVRVSADSHVLSVSQNFD